LLKHLIPGTDLVPFLNKGNCLGFGIYAAMIFAILLDGYAGLKAPKY